MTHQARVGVAGPGAHRRAARGRPPGGAESVDVLATREGVLLTRRPRIATTATHGTGCTLSSAIAALVARRGEGTADWAAVVEKGRDYLQAALTAGACPGIGSGHGPVHHFAAWWAA